MTESPSSVTLSAGDYTAEVGLRGGQLRRLTHGEDNLIVPASADDTGFAGSVLAPWPNRVAGASYTHQDVIYSLEANEEQTGAALHGLLADLDFSLRAQREDHIELQGILEPTSGYPFHIDIVLFYHLSPATGLASTLMARYHPQEDDDAPEEESQLHAASDDKGADAEPAEAASGAGSDDAAADDAVADDAVADDAAAASEADQEIAPGNEVDTADDAQNPSADAADEAPSAEGDAGESDADEGDADETGEPEAGEASRGASPRQTAPFGAGFHPYLTAADAALKECRLRLPAGTMLTAKASGQMKARKPVTGEFDLTRGALLGGRRIDHAYTDLPEEGWLAELSHGPTGFTVRMIADAPWAQVYTGDSIGRAGVAVEPMSCPPDAFNSGEDLVHLAPGEWFRMGYSIEAIWEG